MMSPSDRMSAADYLRIVGGNQPVIDEHSPLIERLFADGAPFASPNLSGVSLGPEDRVSADFYELMRAAIRERRFIGMCSHVANESHDQRSRRAILRTQKKKAMGMIPGSPDWWFIWTTFGTIGAGVIELKRPGRREGGLSQNQSMIRDWCCLCDIPWACHNNAEKAFQQLVDWGAAHA